MTDPTDTPPSQGHGQETDTHGSGPGASTQADSEDTSSSSPVRPPSPASSHDSLANPFPRESAKKLRLLVDAYVNGSEPTESAAGPGGIDTSSAAHFTCIGTAGTSEGDESRVRESRGAKGHIGDPSHFQQELARQMSCRTSSFLVPFSSLPAPEGSAGPEHSHLRDSGLDERGRTVEIQDDDDHPKNIVAGESPASDSGTSAKKS
ncbi:hypothetical protein IAU59_005590 [Kwoniella sp. CBS 9459]